MSLSNFFTASDSMQSILEKDTDVVTVTKTKIACTLGPKTREIGIQQELLIAGMQTVERAPLSDPDSYCTNSNLFNKAIDNLTTTICEIQIARIDTSWGSKQYHQVTVNNLRRAMSRTKILCALILDTRGPDIQVINRPGDSPAPIKLKANERITLTCDTSEKASETVLPVSCGSFKGYDLQPGSTVFVGQYLFTGSETSSARMVIEKVTDDTVECVCENTAELEGVRLVVHFHDNSGSAPVLGPDDVDVISTFGVQNKIDYLSLSYCRSAQDVMDCRKLLDRVGLTSTKIIAKIETLTGLNNIVDIVPAADGIILSRGQLGVEIQAEKMFRVQKAVIKLCNYMVKPVIATRVVDSMTENPRPTRAEATDVANLVLDGTDCILLGAETFKGNYPVEALQTVSKIARRAEMSFDSGAYYQSLVDGNAGEGGEWTGSKREALASSAVRAAAKLDAALIIAFTITGNTARTIAKYRPPMPVLSVVFPRLRTDGLKWSFTGETEARQVLLSRGVTALLADPNMGGTDESSALEGSMLSRAIAYAYEKKWLKLGDRIVVSQCPKSHEDDSVFSEEGVVKIVVLTKELLETSILVYNTHSMSVSSTQVQRMFKFMPKAASFKGKSINALPALISLHRDEDGDDDDVFDIGKPGANAAQRQVSDKPMARSLRAVQSHRLEDLDSGSPKDERSFKWAGPIARLWHRQRTV